MVEKKLKQEETTENKSMDTSKKITQEELRTLQNLNEEHLGLIQNMGQNEFQIINLKNRKKVLMDKADEVNKNFNKFREYLKETYGEVNINIDTGEISSSN